jgi:DNA-binding NtrC family response regulator
MAAEERQAWASCLLANILLASIEEQTPGKGGIDYAAFFRGVEGFEPPPDPAVFLHDVNNWMPTRVMREIMVLGERLTGRKDFAYHAARSYFKPGKASFPSLFEIILHLLNDVRSVLSCANLCGAVQTNYLKVQSFERPGPPPNLYLLTQFEDFARPMVGSIHFVRGFLEGFARLYPFIEDVRVVEEVSQLAVANLEWEFPSYAAEREGDRVTIRPRLGGGPEMEARRVALRAEVLPLALEMPLAQPDLAVVPPREGRLRVLTPEVDPAPHQRDEGLWAYQVTRGGTLSHEGLSHEVPTGWLFNAPYSRWRFEVREGRHEESDRAVDVRREASRLLFDHLQQMKRGHVRLVQDQIEKRRLAAENLRLRQEIERDQGLLGVVGRSEAMRELYNVTRAVAGTDVSVLISGETGSGKEMVARAIHHASPRRARRFVAVNCGALAETLLESELFGHEKGAFTGAINQRKGIFEAADGGTLFLDEIGEIAPSTQVKLLRVLQDGELQRLGGADPIRVDVRIIAATNKDLQDLVRQGRFREDLYYRLKVFPIAVPPLRDRRDDVPALAAHLIEKHRGRMGKAVAGISPAAMAFLMAYEWPGNVRELENLVLRMLVVARGEMLDVGDLPPEIRGVPAGPGPAARPRDLKEMARETTGAVERRVILEALERNGWNVTRTAAALGISRAGLQNKMKAFGLSRPAR